MNVLQILPELNVGGVETGTVDIAKYLLKHGHRAIVVSNGGDLVCDLENMGARHYRLPVHQKSIWAILKSIKALAKIIREEKVDIVHARSRVPAWIAFFACRKTKTAFITTCHGYYSKHVFSRVMGWGKLVIVPSDVIGRHMIDDFDVVPEKIRRIARSVDLEKFSFAERAAKNKSEYVVSIIGRITPLKGHAYFLKAMAKAVRLLPNVKIWIIGDAPAKKEVYKDDLKILVQRLGLSNHVEFLGNRRDIPQLLAKSDVLVLSTITEEAFGRVILEAQAAKVPVVATKVGGVVEIIDDGKTGLLVLPKDTEGMAKAVVRVLRDKKLAEALTTQAHKKLESQFTLEHMAGDTVKAYQELLQSLNILVIKISSIGDVVLVTPSLKAIREKFPQARIFCLVGKESREVLQRCPYIDELIVYDYQGKDKGWRGLVKFSKELRRCQFDKVIDFQNNRRSHALSFLSFPLESYGYHNGKWGFLLSHPLVDDGPAMPAVSHQFQLLKLLGVESKGRVLLEVWPSQQDEEYVKGLLDSEWLGNTPNIVGVNIAASAKWMTKNWPLKHIARLCDILSSQSIRVVITGTEKDKETVRQLLYLTKAKPADFSGKTNIPQLAALIRHCRVFISPDSAPLHLASAVGTPFVALFGPTDPARHLPPSDRHAVLRRNLECSPCYNGARCRIKTHACMNDITPEEVIGEIEKLMKIKK